LNGDGRRAPRKHLVELRPDELKAKSSDARTTKNRLWSPDLRSLTPTAQTRLSFSLSTLKNVARDADDGNEQDASIVAHRAQKICARVPNLCCVIGKGRISQCVKILLPVRQEP
jgi:hypothetical protein